MTKQMIHTIMMAKRYQERPSEIMNIENDYLAYIFDEVAMYLENKATDKDGNLNWNKIRWKKDKKIKANNNSEYIKFVKSFA